jgi:hypothetical protein
MIALFAKRKRGVLRMYPTGGYFPPNSFVMNAGVPDQPKRPQVLFRHRLVDALTCHAAQACRACELGTLGSPLMSIGH